MAYEVIMASNNTYTYIVHSTLKDAQNQFLYYNLDGYFTIDYNAHSLVSEGFLSQYGENIFTNGSYSESTNSDGSKTYTVNLYTPLAGATRNYDVVFNSTQPSKFTSEELYGRQVASGTKSVPYVANGSPVSIFQGLPTVGTSGNDTFDGNYGHEDVFDGRQGTDTVTYAAASHAVAVDLNDFISWDGTAHDRLFSIENIVGSPYDDIIHGDGFSNVLSGGDGNDIIDAGSEGRLGQTGNGGADTIDGGNGSDTVTYAGSYFGTAIDLSAQLTWDGVNNDKLISIENAIGTSYNDTLNGDAGNNILDGGSGGADKIYGGAGSDTVSYASAYRGIVIDLYAQLTWDGLSNDVLNSIENGLGSSFNDTLNGDDGNNILDGGDGGADAIYGGLGTDTVSYASSSRGVTIDLNAQLTWDGVNNDVLNSIEGALGSKYDDVIQTHAPTVLNGGHVLDGGAGNDTISYADADRRVNIYLDTQQAIEDIFAPGFANSDKILNFENIRGSNFGGTLQGDSAANLITGGTGNDVLNGGGGADTLTGGAGFDGFAFRNGEANGDVVTDFNVSQDSLSFYGYGTAAQGASLTKVDATHYTINSADGTAHDTITFSNGAVITANNYTFI